MTAVRSMPACQGSSPLARGLPHRRRRLFLLAGIIPARAGFTGCATTCVRRRRDHPRSRGVYAGCLPAGRTRGGSSPLARGLQEWVAARRAGGGIIPARAGFTGGCTVVHRAHRDHPRSRGVYLRGSTNSTEAAGSSPLARGLRRKCSRTPVEHGIIPARAGFTGPPRWRSGDSWDHPRSRGVYSYEDRRLEFHWGSSPLARGLRAA